MCVEQQERLDIEEKYTSLQEEAQGKTKKLKKVWTMLMAAKSEVRWSACCLLNILERVTGLHTLTSIRFRWLICSRNITERSKACWRTSGSWAENSVCRCWSSIISFLRNIRSVCITVHVHCHSIDRSVMWHLENGLSVMTPDNRPTCRLSTRQLAVSDIGTVIGSHRLFLSTKFQLLRKHPQKKLHQRSQASKSVKSVPNWIFLFKSVLYQF